MLSFFFTDISAPSHELLAAKGPSDAAVLKGLNAALKICVDATEFTHEVLEQAFRSKAKELGLKTGQFFYPVRVAITGRTIAPPLFDTMAVLGPETCVKRISQAAKLLEFVT